MGNHKHSSDGVRVLCEYIFRRHRQRRGNVQLGADRARRQRRASAEKARATGTTLGRMDRPGRLSRLSR